jgi:hypothetical protein
MQGYKEPSFQDRMAIAQSAKNKALAQMRSRPAIDPAEKARRIANQVAKDEAKCVKRVAANDAKKAAQAAKKAEQSAAQHERDRLSAEMALAAQPRVLTEAELKAARDLKYAARKARKTGRA